MYFPSLVSRFEHRTRYFADKLSRVRRPGAPHSRRGCRRVLILPLFLMTGVIYGQTLSEVTHWSLALDNKAPLQNEQHLTAVLEVKIQSGWHIYSLTQQSGGPTPTSIHLTPNPALRLNGPIGAPPPHRAHDPNFDMDTETYEGTTRFSLPLVMGAVSSAGARQLEVMVDLQACSETQCLPPATLTVRRRVEIAPVSEEAVNPVEKSAGTNKSAPTEAPRPDSPPTAAAVPISPPAANATGITRRPLLSFMGLAALMGALSLLTPCVFPMIPITVSYFSNHAGETRRQATLFALLYAAGIVFTFTGIGLLLTLSFGAGGVNQLVTNPWVNLLIAVIFFLFALSLFGAYFIQVPGWLLNRLNLSVEGTCGTAKRRLVSTLLMGVLFSMTSFTCTAPFIGTMLVMATQGSWLWPAVGMFAFATVFALPFFVLALAPQWMMQLPRSGSWMNSVKVVMGFLEIAALMKFVSNADMILHWGIFTRQVVLSVWVVMGVMTSLYLLGGVLLRHDSPVSRISATRLLLVIASLTVTVWLCGGLAGRPMGELESFLPPPDAASGGVAASGEAKISWILNDYPAALAEARRVKKPIFIDFTGYTCTNCRWMEANMFPRPEVNAGLQGYVRARLYTDGDGKVFRDQQNMERDQFGTVALPLYAILSPDGRTISTFPGLTRNPNEFVHFLHFTLKQQ